MKLKKIIPLALMAICLSFVMPALAKDETPTPVDKTEQLARAQHLVARLHEIQDMDKSNLTSSEKKALRQELKAMKKEFKRDRSTGVYLSVGAVIIIILLLILILR